MGDDPNQERESKRIFVMKLTWIQFFMNRFERHWNMKYAPRSASILSDAIRMSDGQNFPRGQMHFRVTKDDLGESVIAIQTSDSEQIGGYIGSG